MYAASASVTAMLAHFGVGDYSRERTQVMAQSQTPKMRRA
jgi:hypothetical protein